MLATLFMVEFQLLFQTVKGNFYLLIFYWLPDELQNVVTTHGLFEKLGKHPIDLSCATFFKDY